MDVLPPGWPALQSEVVPLPRKASCASQPVASGGGETRSQRGETRILPRPGNAVAVTVRSKDGSPLCLLPSQPAEF